MRTAPLLIAISLCCMVNTSVLAHRDVVPDNYPSHKPSSDCTEPVGIAGLQQKLREYNISRIEVGNVLQAMADNYNLEDVEKTVIRKTLKKHRGNVSHAAKELGLTRTSLYRRMEKYGL